MNSVVSSGLTHSASYDESKPEAPQAPTPVEIEDSAADVQESSMDERAGLVVRRKCKPTRAPDDARSLEGEWPNSDLVLAVRQDR